MAHRKVSIYECCAEVLLARFARKNCPHIRRVRGRLTFMRGQSANADWALTPRPARPCGSHPTRQRLATFGIRSSRTPFPAAPNFHRTFAHPLSSHFFAGSEKCNLFAYFLPTIPQTSIFGKPNLCISSTHHFAYPVSPSPPEYLTLAQLLPNRLCGKIRYEGPNQLHK